MVIKCELVSWFRNPNDETGITNQLTKPNDEGISSLRHETTASGRGRVQALPFQREQRLQENGERCCTNGVGIRETDDTGDSVETVSAPVFENVVTEYSNQTSGSMKPPADVSRPLGGPS